ncbi:hypothetical protein AB434_2071 [Heyndrickxia coagulans]|nr:hypothetical protein AB434_2071 [Heyndrickxia coagulans]
MHLSAVAAFLAVATKRTEKSGGALLLCAPPFSRLLRPSGAF